MKNLLLNLFLLVIWQRQGNAQSNLRCLIAPSRDTISLNDSLSIIPNTILVLTTSGDTIPNNQYLFSNKKLFFKQSSLSEKKSSTIKIYYRVLPFDLEKTLLHIDSTRLNPKPKTDEWHFKPFENPQKSGVLPTGKDLNYSGGLTRGIAVGNNQDLVVNSNFNLQMSGKLSKDIEISAAMTDNNIPIQPDGSTAQLNQFDRIFIQLKRKNTTLNAGDFEITRPESYFVNYFKRVQGLGVQHRETISKNKSWTTKATGAVSRGKFTRQVIQGVEGNQGPYRLQGAEGERFIIIVAGTERVYVDGILMKRGFDNDYIMDYNQGILTFSTNRLISKDSRITAEFDYNDQSFVRTMYAVSSEYKTERLRLHFDLYGEQDGRKSSTDQEIKTADAKALFEGGDNPNIFSKGIDTVVFSNDKVLYKAVENLLGKTIFIFSKNPDSARYAVRFLEVNDRTGDYNVKISAANGRVFEYVGEGLGSYRIGTKLTTPKLIQIYSLGADYQFFKKKNATFKSEFVMSNNDQNRLSSLDKKDDLGFATMLQYKHRLNLNTKWKLNFEGAYEGTQQHFKVLNPYRPIEFTRDWNTNSTIATTENLLRGNISLSRDSLGELFYEFNHFQRAGQYEGNKQNINLFVEKKGWSLNSSNSLLTTRTLTEKTTFFRPKLELKKVFYKKNTLGFYVEKEANQRFLSDTLSRLSFDYQILKAYLQIEKKKGLTFGTYVQQRVDFLPSENKFQRSSTANELNFNGNFSSKKGVSFGGNLAYRKLIINNAKLTNLQAQETYLGRLNFSLSKLKGAFSANTSYEIGSGQEQRIEYYYQKVQSGLGNLSWKDFNKDGNIQQDEVFPAVFQDSANIVRFVLPTNQFVRTNNLVLNQLLNLTPKLLWYQKKGIRKKISHFSTESSWQILNKVKIGAGQATWNPLVNLSITDTALVAATKGQRHTLYFNRNHQKFEMSIGRSNNFLRNLLTSGYDIRGQEEDFLRMRWNISKKITSRLTLMQNNRKSESEFFPLRNYQIFTQSIEPELNILPNKNFRCRISYKLSQSLDTIEAREEAKIQDFSNELTYNYSTKTAIRTKVSFVKIAYDGSANSPVQYVMLNALQKGQNFLWSFQLNQALNKTLQLEIRYDGRKTGTATRIVHTGNMAIRALF